MRPVVASALGVGFLIGFISSAEAVNIGLAQVQNGIAVVQGGKAAPNATITWEGSAVTKSNKNGGFSFSGVVPADCTGTLSDGVTTLNVALSSCTPVSSGAPAPVPQTGQTTSIFNGDDGALQKGVAWPNPRFTNVSPVNDTGAGGGIAGNGICDGTETCDGTITDRLTGLIWLQNANCANDVRSLAHAFSDVASLNTNGTMNGNNCGDTSNAGSHQTDWRLPNVKELQSLVAYGTFHPSLPAGHLFTNFQAGADGAFYWSSTSGLSLVGARVFFEVDFEFGVAAPSQRNFDFVLPVRGGS